MFTKQSLSYSNLYGLKYRLNLFHFGRKVSYVSIDRRNITHTVRTYPSFF